MPVEINRTRHLDFDICVYHLLVIRLLSYTLCASWPQWSIILLQAGVRQIQVAEFSTRLKSKISRLWWGYRANGSLAEQHPRTCRFTTHRQDRYYRVLAAKHNLTFTAPRLQSAAGDKQCHCASWTCSKATTLSKTKQSSNSSLWKFFWKTWMGPKWIRLDRQRIVHLVQWWVPLWISSW